MQLKVQLHKHLNHLPTTRWVNHTLYDLRVTHLCNQSPHLGPIYTYNKLPGNAYANQNGVPSLATFNPYDMASYGGGKVIKYHHQPKNITLKIMLASSFCPRSDHQLRWHPDRHLTRNHIPCPQTHLWWMNNNKKSPCIFGVAPHPKCLSRCWGLRLKQIFGGVRMISLFRFDRCSYKSQPHCEVE